MTEYKILTSQKNALLDVIKSYELDPFMFEWQDSLSDYTDDGSEYIHVQKLVYKGTDFFFKFDVFENKQHSVYSPGYEKPQDIEFSGSWTKQIMSFAQWLENLTREISQPDLWAELEKYRIKYDGQVSVENDNIRFNIGEIEQIKSGIQRITNYLVESVPEYQENQNSIDYKLEYLVESAKRQGRKDWFFTAIGVLGGIATSLALDPTRASEIWNILKLTISGIINLLPY